MIMHTAHFLFQTGMKVRPKNPFGLEHRNQVLMEFPLPPSDVLGVGLLNSIPMKSLKQSKAIAVFMVYFLGLLNWRVLFSALF